MSQDTGKADAPAPNPPHFHGFSNLPAELRQMIWQMAICTDETPRIHYYSLFNHDNQQSLLQQMMHDCPPEPQKPHRRFKDGSLCTIFPRLLHSEPSQCSWTEANRFSYLWDAGLWTACKESRAALLWHLDRKAANRPPSPKRSVRARRRATKWPKPKPSDLVTARHQGHDVYVEVRSKRDVICFRFSPQDMAACVSLRWDILLCHLPFFHLPYASDINLAFEFDESWVKGLGKKRESVLKFLPEASDRGLVMRAHWAWMKGEIPRMARLWLIDRGGRLPADYQLSRADDYRYEYEELYTKFPCEPENHQVFVDGENRYVESYVWEGQRHRDPHHRRYGYDPSVPVLLFTWKMKWLCTPPEDEVYYSTINVPFDSESFFRVLRQLPDTDGTG